MPCAKYSWLIKTKEVKELYTENWETSKHQKWKRRLTFMDWKNEYENVMIVQRDFF